MSITTYEDYDSLVPAITPEPITVPSSNVFVYDLACNNVESYLKCTNGIIVENYYSKHNILDNKNRNSLATLIINAEFNHCTNKSKFVTKSARFGELTAQILKRFQNEPEFLYFIPYNTETRSVAKGKLWEAYNYLKKKLRNIDTTYHDIKEKYITNSSEAFHLEFLEKHLEPLEDIVQAWKITFDVRQKLLESPVSSTSVDQYFSRFPVLKGQFGSSLILLDFNLKYKNIGNNFMKNWGIIQEKIIKIADSKNSPEIQLAKHNKSTEILMLTVLPYLLPFAYLKKNKGAKRVKLTKAEILENVYIHVQNGNLLHETISIYMEKLKKYNLTFQPTVVFVGDTLDVIIASYVMINSVLYKAESPLKAIDICFKAFHVLNANYPEDSQVIWLFIQKVVYELTTRFDADYIRLNSLISQITQN